MKAELWRAIARRWLEQFSNVQNAVEAYEKLHAVEPDDREAVDRLKELYAKRRAYKPLFDLLAQEAEAAPEGAARRELWMEMAKLAAERLDMGAQAVVLYKRVLDEEPSSSAALDALEKQAERDKDFATVAEVLERRIGARARRGDAPGDPPEAREPSTPIACATRPKAMSAWRRVLALQPGHAKALRVLRDSYVAIGDYDGLVGALRRERGLGGPRRGALGRRRQGDRRRPQGRPELPLRRRVHRAPQRARASLPRVRASALRAPRRCARGRGPRPALREGREVGSPAGALRDPARRTRRDTDEKLALLDKLVQVTGLRLQDRATAFEWATQGL